MPPGVFSPDGNNYSVTRPTGTEPVESEAWMKDVSSPGAGDGTIITASLLNQIIANLRQIVSDYGGTSDGSDTMLTSALNAAFFLKSIYDPNTIEADAFAMANMVEAGSDGKILTDAERQKMAWIAITGSIDLDAVATELNRLNGAYVIRGNWDASAGTFPGGGAAQEGEIWVVTTGGTVDSVAFVVDDRIQAIVDNASTSTYAGNWKKLAKSGIADLIEDTSPQLGGNLDMNTYGLTAAKLASDLDTNGNAVQFDDATGIEDDSGNVQLEFGKTASAVNGLKATNAATANAPKLSAVGTDTNIDLALEAKGTGEVTIGGGSACRIKEGIFTGDGTTSHAITGLGFKPKYVRIWRRYTSEMTADAVMHETTTTQVADIAAGGAHILASTSAYTENFGFFDNRIISLDSDGFTVDDDGTDASPNKNGIGYSYIAFG